jgi:hypothetical protein
MIDAATAAISPQPQHDDESAEVEEAASSGSLVLSSVSKGKITSLSAPLLSADVNTLVRSCSSPYDGNMQDKPQKGLRSVTVDTHLNPSDGFGSEPAPYGNDMRLAIVTFISRDDSHRCLTAYEPRCGLRLCGYRKGAPPKYHGQMLKSK